jgi:hypothetical protein
MYNFSTLVWLSIWLADLVRGASHSLCFVYKIFYLLILLLFLYHTLIICQYFYPSI